MGFWQGVFSRVEITAVFFGCMMGAVAIAIGTWQKIEKMRAEAQLKQSMINRGMSADEIERVIKAKLPNE